MYTTSLPIKYMNLAVYHKQISFIVVSVLSRRLQC